MTKIMFGWIVLFIIAGSFPILTVTTRSIGLIKLVLFASASISIILGVLTIVMFIIFSKKGWNNKRIINIVLLMLILILVASPMIMLETQVLHVSDLDLKNLIYFNIS